MKTKVFQKNYGESVTAYLPEREDILNLKVGDLAPDCFGKLAEVMEISHQGKDICGKEFVCYYTEFGNGSTCSMSMKEKELVCSVGLTSILNSAKCIALETELAGTPQCHCSFYKEKHSPACPLSEYNANLNLK